jgi:hypothetical protein
VGGLELMDEEKGIWSEFAEEELENNMPDEEDEDTDEKEVM